MDDNSIVSIFLFMIILLTMFIFDIVFKDPNKKFCIKEFIIEKGLIAVIVSVSLYILNNYIQNSNQKLLHHEQYDDVCIQEP